MTAATPERDTRAETLGRIACDAFCAAPVSEAGAAHSEARWEARWEAAAVAVAAHVTNPTAADFDSAAEIMRLRDALERIADPDKDVLDEGLGGSYAEELHVRTNLARQALGLDVCGCSDCCVSLGIAPEDRG